MTDLSPPKTTFAIRPGRKLLPEIKRILLEQVDYALFQLTTPGLHEDTAVHEARKAFKRIRGMLRLVRDEIDHEDYQRLNALFRDAGRKLSDVRTSAVLSETLEKLLQRFPDELSAQEMAEVLARLRTHHASMRERVVYGQALFDEVARDLSRGKAHILTLPLSGHHFPSTGLQRVYARGRKGFRECTQNPSVAHFHEWRKRVKYLRFHNRVLSPIWPEVLSCVTQELVLLSELLGLDHDLAELHHTLEQYPQLGLPWPEEDKLLALIVAYQEELEAKSFRIGARIYVEKSSDFARRMKGYWLAWDKEQGPDAVASVDVA